jgi:Tol biopolymer transport system component
VKKIILSLAVISVFIFVLFINQTLFAQFESHPEVEWKTISTENFNIVYHEGTERTAYTTAKIAEEIFGPITSLYDFKPKDKVNFVINDLSDVANGATDFFNNRIEIFSSALDYELRGTHNWLRNVITHEYTHMVQIQASMKFPKTMPAIYFQWLNYEKERRPDVLYGYPNMIISYPISGFGVPAWFAEGTAQYQRQATGYDYWDAQRDMILRSYVEDDNMLTYNEMGQFSSITSLKAESIYNSGFAFVRYISNNYGEDKLNEVTRNLGSVFNFSIDKAFSQVIGKDGNELYNEWKAFLKKDYASKLKGVKETKIEGKLIEEKGFANYFPQFSPDGKKIAYISNQDFDYAVTGLMLYDKEKNSRKSTGIIVGSNFGWSPDGKKIIYSRRNYPAKLDETYFYDIYVYDVEKEEEIRITNDKRATSPSYSPDGKKIVYTVSKDGTLNLEISDEKLSKVEKITEFKNGEQIYNPKFSLDGKKIIFDYSLEESRKIAQIDLQTGEMEFILDGKGYDFRNPVYINENEFLYCNDKSGIFNIFRYNVVTKENKQITNVLGGAFMPSLDNTGNLTYSSYYSTGYKIALLENIKTNESKQIVNYTAPDRLIVKYTDSGSNPDEPKNKFDWKKLRNFNDVNVPPYKSEKYKPIFNQLSIFPVLRLDNYTKNNNILDMIKPGIYFFSDELMSRLSIFGGAFINRKWERDLFLNFKYDYGMPIARDFFDGIGFSPAFVFEGYNVTRKADAQVVAGIDSISVGVSYDLLAFDLGFEFKLFNPHHNLKAGYQFQKYASLIDNFIIPSSNLQVRGSREDYFKANGFYLIYKYENYFPTKDRDINPYGRKINIRYDFEASDINPEYLVNDDGTLSTIYASNKLHKLEGDWLEAYKIFDKHTLSLKFRGAVIFGPEVDNFYNYYASGLIGMKGYPFYALGGGRMATLNIAYRFPLFSNIDTRISPMYFDKLYFSVYGDIGNAWEERRTKLNDFKKDAGFEFRLQAFTSYAFPTSFFFNAAYGFDEFTKNFRGTKVTYGKEWRLYFGVLFGFDI